MGKIIAITGASSGIGLATALYFANEGWIVYAGTRNLEREQANHGEIDNLHWLEMEVTAPQSLAAAFSRIEAEQGCLDVLFANAGFGYLRALGQAEQADIENVFETNVYGVMHTVRTALPLLRKSQGGHIVVTSSVGGLVGQPFNEIYCASKFAVEGLMESLATYYKPLFNIDITLLEPGAIATNFTSSVMSHIQSTGGFLDDEYKPILQAYLDTFAKRNSVPQTAESVAEVMMELVNMEEKPLRLRTSETADKFTSFKTSSDPTGLKGVQNTRMLHLGL